MQIQTKQNNSRSRDLERAGAETRYVGENRSPRRLHFKTRPAVLCLLETGGRENPFRVSGENGATKRRQASEEHELVSYGAPRLAAMRNFNARPAQRVVAPGAPWPRHQSARRPQSPGAGKDWHERNPR